MEGNRKARSLLLVSGMTLALFAVQAALMKGFLLHIESAGQAMGLSALFALVYGGAMAAYVHLERPKLGELLFAGGFALDLLLETDCPYMAPVPFRGQRNEPAFVKQVLLKASAQVVELKISLGLPLENILRRIKRAFFLKLKKI